MALLRALCREIHGVYMFYYRWCYPWSLGLRWYLMDFSFFFFFFFSYNLINIFAEMLWNYKYLDRGNLTQGVDYPDHKRAEKLNNHRKPLPPLGLRHKGWRWYCQNPGLGVLHRKPVWWGWSLAGDPVTAGNTAWGTERRGRNSRALLSSSCLPLGQPNWKPPEFAGFSPSVVQSRDEQEVAWRAPSFGTGAWPLPVPSSWAGLSNMTATSHVWLLSTWKIDKLWTSWWSSG